HCHTTGVGVPAGATTSALTLVVRTNTQTPASVSNTACASAFPTNEPPTTDPVPGNDCATVVKSVSPASGGTTTGGTTTGGTTTGGTTTGGTTTGGTTTGGTTT